MDDKERMAPYAPRDMEYTDLKVTSVDENGCGFTREDGWSFWCPPQGDRNPDGIVPKVGDTARFYGAGIGGTVRGLSINRRVVFYETSNEYQRRTEEELRLKGEEETQQFRADIANRDARVAALPGLFRERIARFQRFRGEPWRVEFEPYEVFTCEEAVKIANVLDEPEQIAAFREADHETQREFLPELSDGHSGNTFEAAVHFAMTYTMQPEVIVKEHGAMHGLVGCDTYGCWAAEAKEPARPV